ncbi:MAG TPA: tol-pal system protein YbgF [Kofleriaceae bacterium]|nr:tol-pal system protein YbgF [Kofleriaceae bacterium]
MRRILYVLLLVPGCAAPRAAQRPDRPAVQSTELRAQMRRDRRMIRSLENELALLRARMNDTPQVALPPPTAPAPDALADDSYDAEAPLGETLADAQADDSEVEVVYEGEAAAPSRERPRLELRESSRSYRGAGPAHDDEELDDLGDAARLPVLSGEIPTVDAQLRRARVAQPVPADHRRQSAGMTNPGWSASPRAAAPPAAAPPAAAPPAGGDPLAEYQRYVTALRAGNHEFAALGLRAFLDRHPRHDLADNAQYWLAESYYDRKQFSLAQVEFQKAVDRYPRGNKKPDAMLKVAFCQLQAGKLAEGRAALQRLITSFPDSSPAALARAKLEELARR